MATGMLDPGIALLQWLRKTAGGELGSEDKQGSRKDQSDGRAEAGATPAEAAASAPRRRLRAFLVYFGVLLAGGMAGGALAFDLLQDLIIHVVVEKGQLEAALSTQSKAAGAVKQALEQAQARRGEAERKLALLRAGERLASAAVAVPPAREGAGRAIAAAGTASTPAPKSGDCSAIASDNITSLMDCIHKFNR